MKKIVFICRRNRFRSQIAKALFNNLHTDNWKAESYGVDVLPEDKIIPFSKNPKTSIMVQALLNRGIDVSNERSKQLELSTLEDADRIIILTDKKDVPEWLNNYPHEYWLVPDPGILTIENTSQTIELLSKKLLELNK